MQGITTAYGDASLEIFDAYKALFAALPLAVRTQNRVYICHTVPDAQDLDSLDLDILKADTWPEAAMRRRGTVYALTWGRDTSPENRRPIRRHDRRRFFHHRPPALR